MQHPCQPTCTESRGLSVPLSSCNQKTAYVALNTSPSGRSVPLTRGGPTEDMNHRRGEESGLRSSNEWSEGREISTLQNI